MNIIAPPDPAMTAYTKDQPFAAAIKERYPLTKAGSRKCTQHIVVDLSGSNLRYRVGDSIGLFPQNDPKVVERTLLASGVDGDAIIVDERREDCIPIRDFLSQRANLQKVTTKLLRTLLGIGLSPSKQSLLEDMLQPEGREALQAFVQQRWIWDCLQDLGPVVMDPQLLSSLVMPMIPRFYSVASSQRVVGEEVHLTVSLVSYESNGHPRRGVATQFLCGGAPLIRSSTPLYVQPTRDFLLPEDGTTPIIMIGPGTGIAPFVAFMQERVACGDSGKNWLFFGEWNEGTDFYYEDFWRQLRQAGKLRLNTAFSRDQDYKIYVQDRMLENAKDLWAWLQDGAILYVCGDAQRMAKDVHAALELICQSEGGLGPEDAAQYLKELRQEKRYLRDIY